MTDPTAAFAAAYACVAKWRGEGENPNTEPMFRTLPPLPCRMNSRAAARLERNSDVRFNWSVYSHPSSVISCSGPSPRRRPLPPAT